MTLRFFEGPAGSGKTTRLIEDLEALLSDHPLGEDEWVLALTKMHGSRRRMHGRLCALGPLRQRFKCVTIDSFAWHVLRRWRSLARNRFGEDAPGDAYQEVCKRAGALLAHRAVGGWATRTFPIVVVDELQDSKDGQLGVIQALAESAKCLTAGDEYQDLDGAESNSAVDWAREHGEVVLLTRIHRTRVSNLLSAANAVREGRGVPPNGPGFFTLPALNHNVGASYVSRNLTWWRQSNDIAVITPVRAGNSLFVRSLISRVERGPIGETPVGPHRVPWEISQEDELERFLAELALPDDPSAEIRASEVPLAGDGPSIALSAWFDRQRRVGGRTSFTVGDVRDQARLIHQRSRAYRRLREVGVRAMTIHQAKNREFDSVIVLWPYEVQGSADRQRRLLYNAITRAKRQVVVVVQNPDRVNQPPFVCEE